MITEQQEKAIRDAIVAFIKCRELGIDEHHLIDFIFDASSEFTAAEVKAGKYNEKSPIDLVNEYHQLFEGTDLWKCAQSRTLKNYFNQ